MDFGSLTGSLSGAVSRVGGITPPASAKLSSWFPQAASTHAENVDAPFFGIYVVAIFVVVLVVGLAVTYIQLFKRRDEDGRGAPAGSSSLLWQGLFVLGALVLGLFAFSAGFQGFLEQSVTPHGAYAVDVTARQWDWDFTYPNGYVADTLHVATGQPVKLNLQSEDVIHGLFIPELRVSQAILPDRGSEAWFEATVADTFDLRSNIYSGEGYTNMRSVVIAQSQAEFDAWLLAASDIFAGRTMAEVGELLYTAKGCKACHSLDGSRLVGPSFKDVYGNTFDTREGVQIVVDDAYIRESILTPNVSVIAGYEPVMTPYEGNISDKEIEAITAWLKTLSSFGGEESATAGDAAAVQEGN